MSNTPKNEYLETGFSVLGKNKSSVLTILLAAIAIDVFFIAENLDFVTFGILIFYLIIIRFYHLKSRLTFFICLLILPVLFTMLIFSGVSPQTEKLAVWIVLFLLVGIIQQWREIN